MPMPPGGVPPDQEGAPPGATGGQGAADDEEPPQKLKTPSEWKAWDKERRLEEWRHQQSRNNHHEIVDKLGQLLERQDDAFSIRERDRRDFFKAIKDVAFRTRGSQSVPIPSAGSRRRRRGAQLNP
jgi:hypothetical protein